MEKVTKSPAFQFYVQDFLSGVKFFSAEETGAYILLLCEQWDSGFIENNEKILKKITGISSKKLEKVLEKFEKKENKLINKRLEFEYLKKMTFVDSCRAGGEASAKKRAEERARSLEIRLQPKGNSSLSPSTSPSTSEETTTTTTVLADEESATPKPVNADSPKKEKASTDSVKAKKEKPDPKPPTPFPGCMEVYNNFILENLGVPAKIDGQEGKALKTIITYLTQIATDKEPDGIVNAFKFILVNKAKWDPFHQNQLKISQINSNLTNIINSIKNGNAKKSITTNNYDNNKYRTAPEDASV